MIRTALFASALAALAMPAIAQDVPAAAPQAPATAPAAAPAVAEAPKPEMPQTLPTTGDGAVVTTLLTQVCLPLVNGGDFEKLVKAQKMKLDSKTGEWVLPLSQKPFQISMSNPGSNNKGLCDMRVRYAVGWDQPIVDALNVWRFLQSPQLHGKRSDQANYSDLQRVTTTWDNWENQVLDGKMIGLVLVQLNKLDGTPNVNAGYDEATVKFQIRAAQALEGVATPETIAAAKAAEEKALADYNAARAAAAAAAATTAAQPAPAPAG